MKKILVLGLLCSLFSCHRSTVSVSVESNPQRYEKFYARLEDKYRDGDHCNVKRFVVSMRSDTTKWFVQHIESNETYYSYTIGDTIWVDSVEADDVFEIKKH